jgi:hypothetical protein
MEWYMCKISVIPATRLSKSWDSLFQLLSDLQQGSGFSPGSPVSFINKTDRHVVTEILLKVALNTITLCEFIVIQGIV